MSQPAQAGVDSLDDVLARQAALVGSLPHRHGDLGLQHVLVPRQQLLEEAANHRLGGTSAVGVGTVEVEQAVVDRAPEDRPDARGVDVLIEADEAA